MSKCGDYGGVTTKNEPCKRSAGWGVPGTSEGRCKDHLEQEPETHILTAPEGYTFEVTMDDQPKGKGRTVKVHPVKDKHPGDKPTDPEPANQPPIIDFIHETRA